MKFPGHLEDELKYRHARGDTYQEVTDWLTGTHKVKVSLWTVWRHFNPSPKPRKRKNQKHLRWQRLHEQGRSLAKIARADGVTKQAVAWALKSLAS